MFAGTTWRLQQIEEAYQRLGDADIQAVIDALQPADDAELADLIQADGRARVERGLPVSVERYLRVIPDVRASIDAVDAAIDAALRSLTRRGRANHDAMLDLIRAHPTLEQQIRESAALSQVVLSTENVRRVLERPRHSRGLPQNFGPKLDDGRRRYELVALLGEGSGGEVFRATDRLLSETGHDAIVAIKIFARRDSSPWARQRFLEEATKARRIIDPHVVRVIDRGADETDDDYIVYEFVPGGDLQHAAVTSPPRTQIEIVRLVIGMARGLQAAHAAGVVHCDLKPGNILLTESGEPKIADFGVAVRQQPSGPEAAIADGEPIGNLAFIAPEQFRMEEGSHAPTADLYALGGVMYWLATGALPNGENRAEIQRTHDLKTGRTEAPSVRRLRPEFDRDLDLICRRCMAPDPARRYRSAGQLVDDLAAWQRREPIRWTSPSLARIAKLWVRRKPAFAAFLGAILLAGVTSVWLGIVGAEVIGRRRERTANAEKLNQVYKLLVVSTGGRETWELLPLMPYLEWAQGTSVFGDPTIGSLPWRDRINMIRVLYNSSRTTNGPMELETLELESTLAYWLICDNKPDEAAAILTENRRRWIEAMPGAKRWHESLASVALCADIAVLDSKLAKGEPVGPDVPALERHAEQLKTMRQKLSTGPAERAQKRLIERTLAKLYGPKLLDRPDLVRQFSKPPPKALVDRFFDFFRHKKTQPAT